MQFVCSHCHTHVEAKPDADEGHLVCPNCHAEIGIEPVRPPSPAMRYFGTILAVAAFLVIAGSIAGLLVR